MNIKTFVPKSNVLCRSWYVIDAKNKVLGRLSSMIIKYLIGKHKIEYTPHVDIGDYVIVLNAKKVYVTGHKREKKIYYHHTGYVGGLKEFSFKWMINNRPERIIKIAVKGMLPKGSLGKIMYGRLKVYSGEIHHHTAKLVNFLD